MKNNKRMSITIDKPDIYNFQIGLMVSWPRWYHAAWWRNLFLRATWWRQNVARVTYVNRGTGEIHLEAYRWSWLRWRWVPVDKRR